MPACTFCTPLPGQTEFPTGCRRKHKQPYTFHRTAMLWSKLH